MRFKQDNSPEGLVQRSVPVCGSGKCSVNVTNVNVDDNHQETRHRSVFSQTAKGGPIIQFSTVSYE